MEALGLGLGAIVASKVKNVNIPGPPIVRALLPVGVGYMAMTRGTGLVRAAGMGMMAVGIPAAVNTVAPQLGIGATMLDDNLLEISGGADSPALAAPGGSTVLAGVEEVESFESLAG